MVSDAYFCRAFAHCSSVRISSRLTIGSPPSSLLRELRAKYKLFFARSLHGAGFTASPSQSHVDPAGSFLAAAFFHSRGFSHQSASISRTAIVTMRACSVGEIGYRDKGPEFPVTGGTRSVEKLLSGWMLTSGSQFCIIVNRPRGAIQYDDGAGM